MGKSLTLHDEDSVIERKRRKRAAATWACAHGTTGVLAVITWAGFSDNAGSSRSKNDGSEQSGT